MKLLIPLLASCFAMGQAAVPRTWSNVATLSFVATSGNASGNTTGFSDNFTKKWDLMTLTVKGGMIRSKSTYVGFTAIGSSLEDAIVREDRTSSVTAENYSLSGRFDYRLKDRDKWYWYGGSSWEQNLPIGLESRAAVTAGVGRILADTDYKWRVDAGLGVTREEPTVVPPGFQKDFGTFNLTSSFARSFNGNISYNADLACTYNLKKMEDRLYVFKQGLTVTMAKGTALKVGYDMNYRNIPGLVSVRTYNSEDPPVFLGNLIISAKKLDTLATTSLVISF
ncbi:MAG: DUF481 domain-containing protein [Holophagaceae bacterium]|nr:DUF481 domain-containing protein [Holophagaceae bacterium]